MSDFKLHFMRWRLLAAFLFLLFLGACVQPHQEAPEVFSPPESVTVGDFTDVLIYGGPGSWRAEVESLKTILYSHGATYRVLTPSEINQLSLEDFSKFHAILFAGGDAPTVRKLLTPETRARLRQAVQERGLNYLGFCAGAWLAVAPAPNPGEDVIYGLGVVNGPVLKESFLARMGSPFLVDEAVFPDGRKRKQLWYGGPETPDLPWRVLVRYSNGTPAISQIQSGQGIVVVSGLHPAADKKILSNLGIYEHEVMDPDFAWALLEAVIQKKPLPTF